MHNNLTPREIVSELDRYIIGQNDAKKAVAIALRNRYRRLQVAQPLRDEIVPKNILMIGPTGCGKTEVSRRLAKLAKAPFLKVEATKFTEIGYVGRDVDSIIRDLVEVAISMTRKMLREEVKTMAEKNAMERVIDALVGKNSSEETREKFRQKLLAGDLDDKEIQIEVEDNAGSGFPMLDIPGMPGSQMGMINVGDMLGKAFGKKTKLRKMTVAESYPFLLAQESDNLLDEDELVQKAIYSTENNGIVFIDEIDKVAARQDVRGGEVSREGVQRDLLPLLEGTVVNTKYGAIKTDHILFIASGAFHMAKPSDLLPELQGRLPIRVELSALTVDDMENILKEPEASLSKQYAALLAVEGFELSFSDCGIRRIAEIATDVNKNVENIGARRLHTMLEKLLEEVSFGASDMADKILLVDAAYVDEHLGELTQKSDLSRFIL